MLYNKILVFNMMLLMKPKLVSQTVVSSLVTLEPLLETQGYVVRNVQQYITRAKKEINFIENHLNNSVNTLRKIRENPEYISNIINAYSFINRVRRQYDFIRNFTRRRIGYYKDPSLIYPCMVDLIGAAMGIIRLQITYRMNVTDLAEGRLVSNFSYSNNLYIEQVRAMSACDRYFLGTMRELQGFSGQLKWMLAALRLYRTAPERLGPLKEKHILYKISQAYYHLNKYNRSLVWWNKLRALEPVHEKKKMDAFKLELQENIARGHNTRKQQKRAKRQPINLYGLCYKDLKYRNDIVKDPHLLLWCERSWPAAAAMRSYAPTRIEWLQLAPRIALFYDVISDREIEDVKTLAKPNMRPSKANILPLNNTLKSIVRGGNRLSMEASLETGRAGVVARLARRLRDVTGFHMRAPECHRLLVVDYGIAGAHSAHIDSRKLSDVEQGGALVFPNLGVKVYPRKGTAVSWIAEDQHMAKLLMHLSCPVIRGSKWIIWAFGAEKNMCFRRLVSYRTKSKQN